MIAKHIDSTFPHTSSILSELEAQGLVKSRPEGRIRYLELTDRGRRIARALQELSDLLKKSDA
jgi:DNA-binding MarR family transcriptional regulator